MPRDNQFRHQVYTDACPTGRYELCQPDPGPDPQSAEFLCRMRGVADRFRQAGVSAIYLVHGTFFGTDAVGLWRELSRLAPSYGSSLRQLSKQWIDALAGEHGNFTPAFAEFFEDALNQSDRWDIPVRLFNWSSENHHIGRADAAVRLLDELDQRDPAERVLLWGHSHAGNVFALLTHLLGGDLRTVNSFFDSAETCFRHPLTHRIDSPIWERMQQRLLSPQRPLNGTKLDLVTFGTPIRYGWESKGYCRLLHFINHRPVEGQAEYLAELPQTPGDILQAAGGDYVQQLGIAGTNMAPGLHAWRTFWADRRLNRLLQSDVTPASLGERLRMGMRVPAEGMTLLCDYGCSAKSIVEHHAGHAVYTEPEWLLFHAEQTAARLYDTQGPPVLQALS